jgi:hypothetical protein
MRGSMSFSRDRTRSDTGFLLLCPGIRRSSVCLLFHRMSNRCTHRSVLIECGASIALVSTESTAVGGRKVGPGRGLRASDRRSLKLTNTRLASMAAAQDAEHGQILLNSCVRLPPCYFMLTHWISPEPSTSPNSGTRQGRECVDPSFRAAMLAQELLLYSTQIPGSQGSPSQIQVEVTGIHFDLVSMRHR